MAERGREQRVRQALEHGGLQELARMLVAGEDPDDLVQEAIARGLEHREPPHSWLPWLRQVLRNLVRARVRRRTVREARLLTIVEAAQDESLEMSLDRARMLDALRDAMGELEEPYRSTVRRRFLEDLTPLEIARQDGDPPATVRWRVHEGLARIRSHLDRRFGGRDRWFGGFCVGLGLPLPRAAFAKTGLLVALGIAGATAAILTHQSEEARAVVPFNAPPTSLPTENGSFSVRTTTDSARSESSVNVEIEVEDELDPGAKADATLLEALTGCLDDLPRRDAFALGRLELEVHTWTLADGSALIESVDLTTGREFAYIDDVDATTPRDAPGVVVHDELATCIAFSIDTDRLPTWHDGWSGGVAAHQHTHPFRLVVEIDGRGNLLAPVSGACPTPGRPLVHVDLDEADVPDPDDAVVVLDLPQRGAKGPSVTRIVECGSYRCPFCKRSEQSLRELEGRDPRVSIAWLHFPLDQDAADLARATVAAHRQHRFWDMHDALFEQTECSDSDAVLGIAERLGLDVDRFAKDLADPQTAVEVARQRRVCETAGVRGTPAFFVDGDLVPGARDVDALAEIIDATRDAE